MWLLLAAWVRAKPTVIFYATGQNLPARGRHPVDGKSHFANTKFLEDTVLQLVAERPEVKHLILIGIAVLY
jgi:hypothetical protein